MGPSERQQNAISLEALLAEEREAILAANFEGLERISSEKERLTQAIGADSVDEKTLAKLRDQIERNGLLLNAMREGVGSALQSLRSLRESHETLSTYDQTGRKLKISASIGKVDRRA